MSPKQPKVKHRPPPVQRATASQLVAEPAIAFTDVPEEEEFDEYDDGPKPSWRELVQQKKKAKEEAAAAAFKLAHAVKTVQVQCSREALKTCSRTNMQLFVLPNLGS